MNLNELDFHSNQITSNGFQKLIVCLKTNNKVKSLNISKNDIALDVEAFKMIQKFLNCNKVLENLNMSFCGIGK